MSIRSARRTALAAAVAAAAVFAGPAVAQDLNAYMANSVANTNAMLNAAIANQNNIVAAAQNRVAGQVQQGMADPRMQQQYMMYRQQSMMSGRPPVDFATYVYQSQYTMNFSSGGTAMARANEAGIANAEMQKYQDLRAAQAYRAQMQGQYMAGQDAIARERGNGLMGNSTYYGGQYGGQQVLPHTWAANTYNYYQGNQYRTDASGNTWQLGNNGTWYMMQR